MRGRFEACIKVEERHAEYSDRLPINLVPSYGLARLMHNNLKPLAVQERTKSRVHTPSH
jgi:hypothetical protein